MTNYAIIEISGKQFKVNLGSVITVSKILGEKGSSISIEKVLAYRSNEKTEFGQPYILGSKVELEVIEQKKGQKISVKKYKQKVRYRRKMGFRPLLTVLKVVNLCGEKATAKKADKVIKEMPKKEIDVKSPAKNKTSKSVKAKTSKKK